MSTPLTLTDHEMQRRECWIRAWTLTANANDCKHTQVATRYADTCLREFDTRFRAPSAVATTVPRFETDKP